MREKGSLRKRASRYAKVTSAVAGAGLRVTGTLWGNDAEMHQKRAEVFRAALGGLKGPLMKVAQILGTIPDLIPEEYRTEFAQLQADAPSMGWSFVRRRMAGELGQDWEKKFASFNHEASAAASLGQVHKARGLNGQNLACKLQYPDMSSVVEADLKQLKIILSIYEHFESAVRTQEVQAELADRLFEELDYRREAKHMLLFKNLLQDEPAIHVPDVVPYLCTDRLLTMTWLDGQKFVDVIDQKSQEERNILAINLHRAWYRPFYDAGILHGDPHLGNYTLGADNSINLLDFGCVRVFTPELVESVITLYKALLADDEDMAVQAYKAWGFINPTKELVAILNMWAKFVYAPLLQDTVRPIEETNTGAYGKETAAKVHAALRKEGGIDIPRVFVFMDRAAIGLGSVFLRLHAQVNWYRLFQSQIENFSVEKVRQRQKDLLKIVELIP